MAHTTTTKTTKELYRRLRAALKIEQAFTKVQRNAKNLLSIFNWRILHTQFQIAASLPSSPAIFTLPCKRYLVASCSNHRFVFKLQERMYEETLQLINDGVFSLTQICEAVSILSKFYPNDKERSLEMTDRLWTGILSKDLELTDTSSIVSVFR